MNIQIPDNWLRDFLKTKATPKQIAEYLSLCGPSVERLENSKNGAIYHIEITTNRVDSASVYGVAREAAAILPRFKLQANLNPIKVAKLNFVKNVSYLKAKVDTGLCSRFSAVLIRNVKITDSPQWMKDRLASANVRPINNVVDISNYIMHEIGQPVHIFDYDKIKNAKMILRESKAGEQIVTLDGKTHKLSGGDIVIEDASGRLIDLAGIMGAENSAVDANTKNILLFVQTYNPVNIRRTSMSLAVRTTAAVLFEKNLDPELVSIGISRGINLFKELTHGTPENKILDIYPDPYKTKEVRVDYKFLTERLGIDITKSEVSKILVGLEFKTRWQGKRLKVSIPSFRAGDIEIPEDVVEEVARIYGYHNFPSFLMEGAIPQPIVDAPFTFEEKIKSLLAGWEASEIYTLSLVPKLFVGDRALKLKNPLGTESEYLRTSLLPSLVNAGDKNKGLDESYHLFEIANIYLSRASDLPEERMLLGGIFANTNFREAKGTIEALLESINIEAEFKAEDSKGFLPSHRLEIYSQGTNSAYSGSKYLGQFGDLENNKYIYYEFEIQALRQAAKSFGTYKPIPKYPAQIEDITLTFPERTKIGDVINFVIGISDYVSRMELVDTYEDSYTFRIWYQNPNKTLNNEEVEKIREKLLSGLKEKFGAST